MALSNTDLTKIGRLVDEKLEKRLGSFGESLKQDIKEDIGENLRQNIREDIKEDYEKSLTKFKSEIFDKLDKVMGELQTKRQEQITHTGQHRDIADRLENHENRLGVLEHNPISS